MAHRATSPARHPRLIAWAAGHSDRIVLPLPNLAAATACLLNLPGTSPSLAFLGSIIDLRAWTALFAAAAVLLIVGQLEAGHLCGLIGWLMLAADAVIALATLSTPSPSGSIISAGLMVTAAARHLIGFGYAATLRRRR